MEENEISIQSNIIATITEQSLKFRLEVESRMLDEWGIERKEIEEAIKKYSNLIRKIKDKIKEINEEKMGYSEDEWYLESETKAYAIEKLQELLESEG